MDLTLTATARQARFLRDRWGLQQLQQGITAWETPPIFSIEAWLHRQWDRLLQQGFDLPHLLSPQQERLVWRETLPDELLDGADFLRQGDLAALAMAANRTFHQWSSGEDDLQQLLARTLGLGAQEELELFRSWHHNFTSYCSRQHCLEAARLPQQIAQLLQQQQIPAPATVSLYCHPQWSRAEQLLIELLRELGTEVDHQSVSIEGGCSASLTPFEDEDEEADAVAHWAKSVMLESPEQKVGVIVPGLSGRRNHIDERLGRVLAPEQAVRPLQQLPYHFSSGVPLLQDPRIHAALQLTLLLQRGLPLMEAASLLRSPWLLQGEEMEERSRIELKLRQWGNPEVSLSALIRLLEQQENLPAPRLLGAMKALEALGLHEMRAAPTEWALQISHGLSFFEWAENGEKSETALAAYNSWREGLDRFSSLGDFIGKISLPRAISELRQILLSMELPPGGGKRNIEIMTPEEAEGIHFDALWVMGCNDRSWPPLHELSPLLPYSWQIERIPSADNSRRLEAAGKMLSGFVASAGQVHCSFSRTLKEGGEESLQATPLLGSLPILPAEHLESSSESWWIGDSGRCSLEGIEEGALELNRDTRVRGGSSILENQAQCPFRAFVRHRLQAERLEQERPGLDARERGTLLHQMLERCWHRLERSSLRLKALDEAALRQLVVQVADETVEQFRHSRKDRMGDRFSQSESGRLGRLALRALELDRKRVLEFMVEEMEQQHRVDLEGVSFSVKMDRVDRLEDGRRILIDYKGGRVSRSSWQGERPEEPQLPLYATLLQQVSAVLFGQIRVDEVLYKGEQADEELLQGADGGRYRKVVVTQPWEQQIEQWRGVVASLAREFRQGVATVDPLKGRGSCQYCGLEPLCRVEYERESG